MKILNFELGGFKNLTNTKVNLSKVNAIIALNNYGKSNLVEALKFGLSYIKGDKSDKKRLIRNQDCIPINKMTAGKDYLFDITFVLKINKVNKIINYSFSFEWYRDDKKGARINKELLRIKESQKGAQFKTYIKRDKQNAHYLSSPNGRCDTSIKISKTGLLVNKLAHFDNLFYLECINEINDLTIHFVSLIDPDRIFKTIRLSSIDFEKINLLKFGELSGFIYYLKEHKPNKYELLINSIKSLLPNIEDIKPLEIDFINELGSRKDKGVPFRIPEFVYEITVKEHSNNQRTSISNISSGSKKIIYILSSVILAEIAGVPLICIEELENSIHPSLLQRLLMIIDGMTEKVDIIITSHSPYLIKFLNLNETLLGIPNSEGVAKFGRIKKSKQNRLINYAQDQGVSLGDFLFDLMLEEQEEGNLLSECIEY